VNEEFEKDAYHNISQSNSENFLIEADDALAYEEGM